jgi:hypothetical protein
MSLSHPEAVTEPGGGWWAFVLAMVLVAGAVATVAVPVAAPAAVAERRTPPPTSVPPTSVPSVAAPPIPVPPTSAPPDPAASSSRVPAMWMPVAGTVARGFDARAGPYGPGHRGIDIAAPVGELVRAPAAGRVVFAGPVAGVNRVSLLVAPGVLVTRARCSSRWAPRARCDRGSRWVGSVPATWRRPGRVGREERRPCT